MEAMPAEAKLVNAVMASDLTVKDLWLRYLALGGCRTRQELQDYLSGQSGWTTEDRDLLTHALTEHWTTERWTTEHWTLSSSRDDDIKP